MKTRLRAFSPHLLVHFIFFVVAGAFFYPLYEGKTLLQSDKIQLTGIGREVISHREKGEEIHWTNTQFSGMPELTTLTSNPALWVHRTVVGVLPIPIAMMLFLFSGFYVLMSVLGVRPWIAAVGAAAYAFSSFNLLSIEAGHDNKVFAISWMSPVLAGVIWAYNRQYIRAFLLTSVSLALQIFYGHVQISYYLLVVILTYSIFRLIPTIRRQSWKPFLLSSAVLLLAACIAIGINIPKLWMTYEYGKVSTRGGSELVSETGESSGGLDREYAFAWSNGVAEAFTLMIPYFHGGGSAEGLSRRSELARALKKNGINRANADAFLENVPLYWGSQPFTAGPVYFGIITVFLFVLSYFLPGKKDFFVWGLAVTILSLLLAMGKNFPSFNNFLFAHLPLYNKFRSVTMAMAITQLIMPMLGFLALENLFREKKTNVLRPILKASAIVGGVLIFFLLFKSLLFDFATAKDATYNFPEWLLEALRADRLSLFANDAIRNLVLVMLAAAGLWYYAKNRLNAKYCIIVLALLTTFDLVTVNRRYLQADDFQSSKRRLSGILKAGPVDEAIRKDKSYFRVLNLSGSPFQDGITSAHHFSVGGYSAIKIQRYQDVIDRYLSRGNIDILGMLNAKYIIFNRDNQTTYQANPKAKGNSWLIDRLIVVNTPEEEISALDTADLNKEAVINAEFAGDLTKTSYDTTGTITLASYHPERMAYHFSGESESFAVFSEIYYETGWRAYIDDKKTDYVRVNYLLRGMEIPAGDHVITFLYEPSSIVIGSKIQIASTVVLAVVLMLPLVLRGRFRSVRMK